MSTANQSAIQIKGVKGIALPVDDEARARKFYSGVLGLAEAGDDGPEGAFLLGDDYLLLKADWYAKPSAEPSPRITLEVVDARATESALKSLGVTISDPLTSEGGALFGSFLDSEGNKLWFCSG